MNSNCDGCDGYDKHDGGRRKIMPIKQIRRGNPPVVALIRRRHPGGTPDISAPEQGQARGLPLPFSLFRNTKQTKKKPGFRNNPVSCQADSAEGKGFQYAESA